jgi:hypothetical protein
MTAPMDSYTATASKDGEQINKVTGLSIDAARHIASVHAGMGFQATIRAEHVDYIERVCADCAVPFPIGPELYPGGPRLGQNQTRCGPCTQEAAAPIFGRL